MGPLLGLALAIGGNALGQFVGHKIKQEFGLDKIPAPGGGGGKKGGGADDFRKRLAELMNKSLQQKQEAGDPKQALAEMRQQQSSGPKPIPIPQGQTESPGMLSQMADQQPAPIQQPQPVEQQTQQGEQNPQLQEILTMLQNQQGPQGGVR